MKKNLRLLCLGLAAATFTCSFAQEAQNMTDKLTNADMELGLKGWGFDGEKLMGKNTKNPASQTGFYGMSQTVLEAWNGNGNGIADGYTMQRLGGLPNGTYVFGAYVGASKQYHRKVVKVTVDGKEVNKYEYWSNLDSVKGVELFANEAAIPVATNNPDYNNMECVKHGVYNEGHAMKFNVAVTLSDESEKPGYLDAGLRYSGTNANYIVWDNATLYFFGEMSEAEALEAMAKLDVANAIAIADTLKNTHINVDTLSALTSVLADAKAAEFTAADFNNVLAEVYWTAGLARKSAVDYKNLENNIKSAEVVAAGTWSAGNAPFVAALNAVIADAKAAYEAKAMNRAQLTALRKELNWSAGDVKYDSLYIAADALKAFIDEARNVEGQPGGYTSIQIQGLRDLQQELQDTMFVYEQDAELEMAERTINPNNLYGYIARVYTAIENVKKNTISTEYTSMPIEFKTAEDGWIEGAEWFDESKKIVAYTSPLYRFQGKISNFRITVKKAKNGQKYFCLSGLQFFDGNGQPIELTEDDLSTNADHNTLNPDAPDGGGIAALFDEDNDTYFHSAWQNMPAEAHYLEVNLPNGGYDAFSFRMLSRSNSNGWDQSHTFPGEMVISTPAPERDALEVLINSAKAYNAYSFPEVGYYEADHSYLLNAISAAEALVKSYGSEDECKAMAAELRTQMAAFEVSEEKSIRLPEAGKEYRIVSGFPGYYDLQSVEKAITVHAADTTLWWENVCADSLQQVFMFEPICEEGDDYPFVKIESGENEDGTTWQEVYYCYTLKNKHYELYADSTFTGDPARVKLVEEATDTVLLKWLGRGQWNIYVGSTLHCGDHNSGNPSESKGAYGGIYGISSAIVPYGGGIDGASAWYIREYPTLPMNVAVEGAEFKSELIRFASANTITLTADKACAFADLALYDIYGNELAIDTLVVDGAVATITPKKNLVACSFAFTNAEGVASVKFDAFNFTSSISLLEAAYDKAVAVAPIEGEGVGEYADISAYTAAIEAAEAALEAGVASDEEVQALIKALEDAVAALKINLPEDGKYYFIYNAVEAFEKNHGYKMAMYTDDYDFKWGHENHLEYNRYWQFELATQEELEAVMDSAAVVKCLGVAFYVKNVGTELYIADGSTSAATNLTDDKEAALPYVVNMLGSGKEISLDGLGQAAKRLHAAGHSGGAGKSGSVVYWQSGAGTASAWNIVETQYDVTDIDFTEVEVEQAVVKGTYDLFGRRVVAPTAPGIYIIDGKKKYIKK